MDTRTKYPGSGPVRRRDFFQRWPRLPLLLAASTACLSFSLPPAVNITRLSDLGFGNVGMNGTKQIAYSDASAASFRIDATAIVAQTAVGITFTLPSQLSSGGGTIGIASYTAAWSYTNNSAAANAFNPNTGTTVPKNGANFSVYVWVGAEVDATGSPIPTQYSSSLTMKADAL